MKVYIMTDLEGACSFVDWKEADIKTARGIEYTKENLTAEVNAAIEGVYKVDGDAEIVVEDGHGGGTWGPNFIAEKLDKRIRLIQGRRDFEIEGLDSPFDISFIIGAHSMAGTKNGLMNHTLSDNFYNVWFNETKVGEIGIWAALLGCHNIPVGMISGDYWAVKEAKELLGNIEGVAVKKGINRYTADCMHPEIARGLIKEATKRAILRKDEFKPFKPNRPINVKIEYTFTHVADRAEISRNGQRIDGRTVVFEDADLSKLFTLDMSLLRIFPEHVS